MVSISQQFLIRLNPDKFCCFVINDVEEAMEAKDIFVIHVQLVSASYRDIYIFEFFGLLTLFYSSFVYICIHKRYFDIVNISKWEYSDENEK